MLGNAIKDFDMNRTPLFAWVASMMAFVAGVLCFTAIQNDHDEVVVPIEKSKQVLNKLPAPDHLQFFGFALVDVFWDDPSDRALVSNYIEEVAPFCNIADMLVVEPSDNIVDRLSFFSASNVKAIIHLNFLLFEQVGNDAPSGANFDLRKDFRQRWDGFVAVNDLANRADEIQAFYIGEEPTWNGISFEELQAASNYVKASMPGVKILVVEASASLAQLQVPETVDWVAFDHYFIADIETSKAFQSELALLKSRRTAAHQKVVLIPDAHFIPLVHGHFGVERNDMAKIAEAYYRVAAKDSDIVGLLAYFWPSGFDDPTAIGTRQMEDVREVYSRIGKAITGK